MQELVLHHYPGSPFSEKLRLILGHKRLAWRSVLIPVVMPKPDLVALTGGYRRTPVLQVGADVYCDTALIAQLLDRIAPEPPLFAASAPLAPLVAQWADSTLFWNVIPWAMQPAGAGHIFSGVPPEMVKAFADRAALSAGLRRPGMHRRRSSRGWAGGAGAAVTVAPTDYGRDPVAGTLVGLSADEGVVARDDPRAGRVHVHFPRHGFRIQTQETTAP